MSRPTKFWLKSVEGIDHSEDLQVEDGWVWSEKTAIFIVTAVGISRHTCTLMDVILKRILVKPGRRMLIAFL
jgi:hypothetical protein